MATGALGPVVPVTPNRPTALVTGGSAGLGAEIARSLSASGWCVWAGSRRAVSPGKGVNGIALDVTDPASIRESVGAIIKQVGQLDAVICNAGINVSAPAEELPGSRARAIVDTNLWGTIDTVRAVLPALRESRGSIVAIGSLAGVVSPPGEAYYAASKHGLRGFLESLRYEVARQGVRVTLVEPGFIQTDLAKGAEPDWPLMPEYDRLRAQLAHHWHEAIAGGMPPRKVARHVLTLVRDKNPPLRTRIGADALLVPFLKAVLPAKLFFRIAGRKFGI